MLLDCRIIFSIYIFPFGVFNHSAFITDLFSNSSFSINMIDLWCGNIFICCNFLQSPKKSLSICIMLCNCEKSIFVKFLQKYKKPYPIFITFDNPDKSIFVKLSH
jgi:hypothetical protein